MKDSFQTRSILDVDGITYEYWRLETLQRRYGVAQLPFAHKILLENLLRCEDGQSVEEADIEALATWDPSDEPDREIAFTPSRVLLQDFTGVPAIVDLAAMREAMHRMGGDPERINPLQPVELVIDHSVQVDAFGNAQAFERNVDLEMERNRERYRFLHWGQSAFSNFRVVPPGLGIVHQVNLEYLARVVFTREKTGARIAYPDTLVGTDSHTTMINGLGVLGWGVGGIEAEAAMLGQPVSMLIPQVVGFKMSGRLPEGTTATDLVLIVTQVLRERGVVGKFVEFYGDGLDHLPLADRATIANMSPEYGATCGIFPIDKETLRYLELSGRPPEQIRLVEMYARAQGMFRESGGPEARYSETLELDLDTVESSIAGPKRPQDRISLGEAKVSFLKSLETYLEESTSSGAGVDEALKAKAPVTSNGGESELGHGAVVIAAITSCTNTSNPAVMLGAGLLARKASEKGLSVPPWVKTSLAPGSRVVTEYLKNARVLPSLEKLGFHVVGYGCTTCIGNSGPLPAMISRAIQDHDLAVCSVLSGNRNFEGRIHSEVRMNYLMSPMLVVAYALAGRMDIDLYNEPLGEGANGQPVMLKEIWPTRMEIQDAVAEVVQSEMFVDNYNEIFEGDERWQSLDAPKDKLFAWDEASTYIKNPPYFQNMTSEPPGVQDILGARVLALLGDSVTTDHISPAGAIPKDGPAGEYLIEHGVEPKDFNSFGSRRGNHEVMMRGTFANVRLRNKLAAGREGGWAPHFPTGDMLSMYDAAMRYQQDGTPLIVLAGKEYGSGSSRDWAAKGSRLLGIRAVIAESYERIHRSNLVGMGVLPLQFKEGESAGSLGLTGMEAFNIEHIEGSAGKSLWIVALPEDDRPIRFEVDVRIDTPQEELYFRHGGILQYVLRQLLKKK
ncbi:MAG: aconitate hydratase AcnA [Planctomycetota bacterium]|jgi:aconitate hydratase